MPEIELSAGTLGPISEEGLEHELHRDSSGDIGSVLAAERCQAKAAVGQE